MLSNHLEVVAFGRVILINIVKTITKQTLDFDRMGIFEQLILSLFRIMMFYVVGFPVNRLVTRDIETLSRILEELCFKTLPTLCAQSNPKLSFWKTSSIS